MTEKLRAAAQQALAYILATGEHDQLCDVFDLDDEGRHKPCSCLLQDVLDALRAALAEQPKRTVTYVCPVCAASLERQE